MCASKVYTSAEFKREKDNFQSLCKNLERTETKRLNYDYHDNCWIVAMKRMMKIMKRENGFKPKNWCVVLKMRIEEMIVVTMKIAMN